MPLPRTDQKRLFHRGCKRIFMGIAPTVSHSDRRVCPGEIARRNPRTCAARVLPFLSNPPRPGDRHPESWRAIVLPGVRSRLTVSAQASLYEREIWFMAMSRCVPAESKHSSPRRHRGTEGKHPSLKFFSVRLCLCGEDCLLSLIEPHGPHRVRPESAITRF